MEAPPKSNGERDILIPPGAGARRPGVGAACAAVMRITGRWLLVSWLVPALVMLGLEGRLTAFLAWATPSTLLALGVGALARQQRAPSFLRPTTPPVSLPSRRRPWPADRRRDRRGRTRGSPRIGSDGTRLRLVWRKPWDARC